MIADTVKDGAKEAIASMKKVGVKKCVMLTGDRKEAAEGIAAELGIDEVHAELLPQDKVSQVERLLKEENGKEAGICRRRYQRCAGAHQSGYRHCNGKYGL